MGQTRVKPISQFEVKHKLLKAHLFGNHLYLHLSNIVSW
jgi:hypothetical protein